MVCTFGANYKKKKILLDTGVVNEGLGLKGGREEFEELVASFQPQVMDISKIAPSFKSSSWLWGCSPTFSKTDALPSGAGQLRVCCLGEMQVYMVRASVWKALMPEGTSLQVACDAFYNLTSETALDMSMEARTVIKVILKQNEILWIPCGMLVAERSVKGPLLYGMRKSIFIESPEAKQDLEALVAMMSAGGGAPDKLAAVAAMM